MPADFSGYDVATLHVGNGPPAARVRRFVAALNGGTSPAPAVAGDPPAEPEGGGPSDDVGSNAWALGPGRTKSGRAILLRNPHLAWTAGYYEAHLTVPGVVDFYGDFRIGGPLIVIGGFNRDLGLGDDQQQQRRSHRDLRARRRSGGPRPVSARRRLAACRA